MQTECPHRRFCRLDPTRDELSPQAAERFDRLALFDELRLEGASQATALKAIGCSRTTRLRFPLRGRAKIRAVPAREHGFAPSASAAGRMIARLVRTGQDEPVAFHCGRTKPRRRKFDRRCNACRPHQALGQRTPMQAHHEHFSQSALAA